jgi:hypothetical protein
MRHLARVQSAGSAHGRAENGEELTRFCTQCGSLFDAPAGTAERPHRGRVCGRCGLGMVLTCASETLSVPGSAFMVVTADLRVSAASEAAEKLFAEPDGLYGRPLLSVITSPEGVGELARRVVRAATGNRATTVLPVEAAASALTTADLAARVGPCGNPPAALVVVEVASGASS